MKRVKEKFKSSSFALFKKVLAGFFLCLCHSFTCLGYSFILRFEVKGSLDGRHAVTDSLAADVSKDTYFNHFFLKDDGTLVYPHNRFDNLISRHQDPSEYDMIIDANVSSGCLCANEPLLLIGIGKLGPLEVTPKNSKWNYLIPNSTPPYTKQSISPSIMTAAEAIDPYVQAVIPDVPLLRDLVLNQASKNAGHILVLPHGPLTQSTPDPKMVQSFTQSLLNMIKLGGYMTGQEFYVNLVVNGAESVLKLKTLLQSLSVMPSDDVLTKSFSDAITSGPDAPDAFSVPIGAEGEIPRSGGGTAFAESTTPYSRPIYNRPPRAKVDIDCSNCFKGIKVGTTAKNSIYAADGSWVQFKPNSVPNEDSRIHYRWYGLPSLKAFGLGRALSGVSDPKQPGRIVMDNSLRQSGLYGLMKYRGPIPPIGCASVSNWTELFVGCSGNPDDREGLIKLDGQDDFAEHYWFDLAGKGKRYKTYAPVVCEGEDVKIVSGGAHSDQYCKYTYEWFGPGLVLKEGTTNEYVMTPNVLIGGLTEVNVTEQGVTSKRMMPIETGETLTIKNMTQEMSGVYTRIASRTGEGHAGVPDFFCKECFRIAQLTITVKPSSPKLTSNSPVCEKEDLIISISPTTKDRTEYQWAHESTPNVWSPWSADTKITLRNVTTSMNGVYLVRSKDTKSGCESKYPVTITVEVRENTPINLSLSKNAVYAGRKSILTASLSGTNKAPEGGITITITDMGGNAIRGTDYEPLPSNLYIPVNENSTSTIITTKWMKPTIGDPLKKLIVVGSIADGTSSSCKKTCYIMSASTTTLTINPLFKPAITNGPISPICSEDVVNVALSSTLTGTTYEWTASKGVGEVSGFEASGSSSIIHEKLTNNNHALSGTVIYTIIPRVEDPEDRSLYIYGEAKSLTAAVMPISAKTIVDTKRVSVDALSFNWLPENPPQNNVTYRWYTHADKAEGVIQEGKGVNSTYSIPTLKPGKYKYYISTQEDGYCENKATEIELLAQHHIQLAFDKSELQQGDKAILSANLLGTVIAPDGGISITIHTEGSAEKGTHYDGLLSTMYIPKGSKSVSTTITTNGFNTMEDDKVLVIKGQAKDYIIKESASLTITRNTDNNKITLTFTKPTVDGGHIAKLTASLPPTIHAGRQITIELHQDHASQALRGTDYEHLKASITIPRGENSFTMNAFKAKNNCVIDGTKTLILEGVEPTGYEIQKPNPTIVILDKTGDHWANREITLDFEFKEVRGSETDLLKICLPNCVTSVKPIHIKLRKRRTVLPSEAAKKNINYKEFSFDVTIPANTNCTSVLVHTLIDRNSDIKTLWLTGKADGYHVNSDKINIVTPKILIPNVFTPNGDGQHDTWEIHNLDLYRSCIVTVYSRWGQMVFRSTGYPEEGGWDGTYRGQPLPVGSYSYIIDLRDGSPVLRGYVAIIR